MFDTEQLFKLGLFIGGTAFGTAGITILEPRDVRCAYAHTAAVAPRGKDCAMKTVSTLRENCDDIYEDAKDLNERRYTVDAERAYQEAKALVEEHEATTEA